MFSYHNLYLTIFIDNHRSESRNNGRHFLWQVRRVSQLVLNRDHVFVDTVGLGAVETPTKVSISTPTQVIVGNNNKINDLPLVAG